MSTRGLYAIYDRTTLDDDVSVEALRTGDVVGIEHLPEPLPPQRRE